MDTQTAIDTAHAGGGGTVRVPAGVHHTGPLVLKSNVTLEIENGAVLRFSDDPASYDRVWSRWGGVECHMHQPLLWAEGAENVAVVGDGVLDGNGHAWWDEFRARDAGKAAASEIDRAIGDLNREAGVDLSGVGGSVHALMRPPPDPVQGLPQREDPGDYVSEQSILEHTCSLLP